MSLWQIIRQAMTTRSSQGASTEEPCFWRVDMHSHLIPGIDDGVKSPEEALTCLKQLADWGIQTVITTPHVSRDWYPNSSADIRAGQAVLQSLIDEHSLPIQVAVAAEYMLDEFFGDMLEADDLLAFGTARYLLVELGWAAPPRQLEDLIFRMQTRGYTPVLAHPERYTYYNDDLPSLARLRQIGCLFQLNWGSFTGRYRERAQAQARLLLKNEWVDFISSDLHRPADLKSLAMFFPMNEYEQLRKQSLLNLSLLD